MYVRVGHFGGGAEMVEGGRLITWSMIKEAAHHTRQKYVTPPGNTRNVCKARVVFQFNGLMFAIIYEYIITR